jgi:hypothetical protein
MDMPYRHRALQQKLISSPAVARSLLPPGEPVRTTMYTGGQGAMVFERIPA